MKPTGAHDAFGASSGSTAAASASVRYSGSRRALDPRLGIGVALELPERVGLVDHGTDGRAHLDRSLGALASASHRASTAGLNSAAFRRSGAEVRTRHRPHPAHIPHRSLGRQRSIPRSSRGKVPEPPAQPRESPHHHRHPDGGEPAESAEVRARAHVHSLHPLHRHRAADAADRREEEHRPDGGGVGAASGRFSLAAVLIRPTRARGCRSKRPNRAAGSPTAPRWGCRCSSSAPSSCRPARRTRVRSTAPGRAGRPRPR
jgi:hypothetical protein